ncbi:alpha-D-ribose 1-methylphosphonate 5-triphosphate diphosphatase [Sinisalibacter lacisalsi]|uniref:Alpha-D-ribose 1-methylphosphonate 5-triphosphate diphosphatase n=1 Tax=Sinisalibacter lacisalsi TaxID=1526570 RepID=A0ABQ1QKI2_9RHOB|nr:alpha-D-ribose 1-methylphosphonate 5-triphosphate diphosphatase [Sinisalibacter lacisalsi]GGD31336.1 alpha-D-ribose 1-methylphosphonate 5-triphosphate diphosphatase [Sinisalibacter lacisalsi]
MSMLPPLRLTGATLLRDGALHREAVTVADGVFSDDRAPECDFSGYLLLPGIIDLHGDAFERHIAPRPSAPFPIESGLRATQRDAAAHGVTTAWLAQGWSWEGGMRSPDFAEALMFELESFSPGALIDLRLQVRAETHMPETRDRLIAAVLRHGIDYVVFNNHLPETLTMAARAPHKLAAWAEREGRPLEALRQGLERARAAEAQVPRNLLRLVEAFDRNGIVYGSHDDPDGETRERFHILGAHVAEFPAAFGAAAVARAMGDVVIMGAPNVVRGGSQAGRIPAISLITKGQCDVLVSDYHYRSLAEAAWTLADLGVRSLPRAWAMISTVPARIMRLHDRGEIAAGKRADFVLVNAESRSIEATISAGRIAHLSGEAAVRLLGARTTLGMAAE